MTGLVFVDTNVLVYARDPREPAKQAQAREWLHTLWNEQRGRTSIQVLSEYFDVVTRRFKSPISREDAWDDVQFYLTWNPHPIDERILSRGHEIARRYRLDWWDCLVVAAAQSQECALLLSEDLQDGADFSGLVVRDPFSLGVSDEAGAYTPLPKLASRHRGRGRPRRNQPRITVTG
jgi:predicted nucleic acid-binding protein